MDFRTQIVAARAKAFLTGFAEGLAEVVIAILFFAGPAAVIYGIWQIYKPAGWIVGGALAFVASLFIDKMTGGKRSNGNSD